MKSKWILAIPLFMAAVVFAIFRGKGDGEASVAPVVETAEPAASEPLRALVPDEGAVVEEGTRRVAEEGLAEEAAVFVPEEPAVAQGFFFGRVVADENGVPLAGVEIRDWGSNRITIGVHGSTSRTEEISPITTDLHGEFLLPLPRWDDRIVSIETDGRGRALVLVSDLFSAPENRLEVRLPRAARLVGRVTGGSAEGPGFLVRLETESHHLAQPDGSDVFTDDVPWTAPADLDGRFVIENLPPDVPIAAMLLDGNTVVRREAQRLTLDPGETREVEWRLFEGAAVHGVALDPDDRPVEGVVIWLLPATTATRTYLADHHEPIASATTDAQGAFQFIDVAAGEWVVGPAPRTSSVRSQPRDIAPAVTPLTLEPGVPLVDILVRIYRGHYIEGRITGPDGELVEHSTAWARGREGRGFIWGDADDEGRFRVGPLLPGEYDINAEAMFSGYASSPSVLARSGDTDVSLTLTLGGSIHGTVVDAVTGEGAPASIACHRPDGGGYMMMSGGGNAFSLEGLDPGTYHLTAVVDDGRIGVLRDVVVDPASPVHDLEIRVQRGAWVRVHYEGPAEYGQLKIEQDGVTVARDGLRTGTKTVRPVLPGAVTVRIEGRIPPTNSDESPGRFEREETVQATEGMETEVRFEIE